MLRNFKLKDLNFKLMIFLMILSVMGVFLVGSAAPELRSRQAAGLILGFVVMIFVAFIDYSWVLHFYWIIYFINIGVLAYVLISGAVSHGASRWMMIGGENGIQVQPTEMSKILIILFFAMYFLKHENDLNTFRTFIKALVLLLIPLSLIVLQPDLKNTVTITIVFFLMYYAAGLSYRLIGRMILIIVPVLVIAFILITQTDLQIVNDYQKERIMSFINPQDEEYSENATQQRNSIRAIGSGQLYGKGLNNSEVTSSNKGNFVSELQNDFIFAVAGEETGFIGCFGIIFLLFLIVYECIMTSRKAKDTAGRIICCGIGSVVAVQSFINICVATGLLPNTGTPLPFVSYGLSSLISLYFGMGFVLNVGLQKKVSPFAAAGKYSERRAL